MIELDIYCEERRIGAVSKMLGISGYTIRHYALNDVLFYNQIPRKKHSRLRLTFFDVACINLVANLRMMKTKVKTAAIFRTWLKTNMFKHISLDGYPNGSSLLDILLFDNKDLSLMFDTGDQRIQIANKKNLMEFIYRHETAPSFAIILPISKIFKDTLRQWQNFGG